MQQHPSIRKLSHDKIKLLKAYMEDSHKGRTPKQLRLVAKNFIDRCPNNLLDLVNDKIYHEFFAFLKRQKRLDD